MHAKLTVKSAVVSLEGHAFTVASGAEFGVEITRDMVLGGLLASEDTLSLSEVARILDALASGGRGPGRPAKNAAPSGKRGAQSGKPNYGVKLRFAAAVLKSGDEKRIAENEKYFANAPDEYKKAWHELRKKYK